jgi:hypothetical protein
MDTGKLKAATEAVLKDKGDELTPEDKEILGEPLEDETEAGVATVLPVWAKVPEHGLDGKPFKMPVGKQISFVRILAEWCDKPRDGDKQCIMWTLNVADETIALKRARGDTTRAQRELCMAAIRVVDGEPANWTGAKAGLVQSNNVRQFMDDIGPKGRLLVQGIFQQTHGFTDEQRNRFFADCFVLMTST